MTPEEIVDYILTTDRADAAEVVRRIVEERDGFKRHALQMTDIPKQDGWCQEHEWRFQANSREGDEGSYDECQVCRAETAERERDEALATSEARGRLLDEHRKACAWEPRALAAEARLARAEEIVRVADMVYARGALDPAMHTASCMERASCECGLRALRRILSAWRQGEPEQAPLYIPPQEPARAPGMTIEEIERMAGCNEAVFEQAPAPTCGTCENCGGHGVIEVWSRGFRCGPPTTCPDCDGSGKVKCMMCADHDCPKCAGGGK